MLVDLKKLDYFSDPNSVLFNLRNTLEECSKKQQEETRKKMNERVRNARNSSQISIRTNSKSNERQHDGQSPSQQTSISRYNCRNCQSNAGFSSKEHLATSNSQIGVQDQL